MKNHHADRETGASPGELVVDLRERPMVEEALRELKLSPERVDEVEDFDLALLRVRYTDNPDQVADVDRVEEELRTWFAGKNDGWTPVLGKNRSMLGQFGAYPQTKAVTDFEPQQAGAATPVHGVDPSAGEGVRVGVLDTRLFRHRDLAGHYTAPEATDTFVKPGPDDVFQWEEGHAVFTCGLIAAHAPKATLVARGVLDSTGRASAWDTVKALAEFLYDDVDILALAMGCRTGDGKPALIVERAIERLLPHMVIVAAAGNHGEVVGETEQGTTNTSPTWPAALPGVLGVGATRHDGELEPYSPKLPWVGYTVDVTDEDGEPIASTYLDGKVLLRSGDEEFFTGYARWKGTSLAAAIAAGQIAAWTKPGRVTAAEALARLLKKQGR